ncbi:hypothetical protein SAMN05216228_102844 [Rhizobium tibeticum]|uniref:Uncharacterized protein n=1 Tax=Rhizobium tibeticum TaxID=501024 RepID=A0A1H8TE66_9HYPH|nr:hypothetical protein [Rhizobium tibeticum]SEI14799.1 hypothetical protein RTCCBAU85039_5145 [Rhizobium tibeticum]SEO88773.1 hypothetical protein SAMN05216228_102844 [Rhizobium tibeticum]
MTMPALDYPRLASAPIAPVFLNFRSQIVRPVCFAVVYWDGPGDTLYAFEDRDVFERQRGAADRQGVHVHELSAEEAVDWIAAGGNAVLHEVWVGGVAAFRNLKLAPG